MPAVQICVLGPLNIFIENGGDLAFESAKSRALLAYLAVEAGLPHSRERLASMLWPNRPDSAALANLRHTLSSLRTTLGERRKELAASGDHFFHITPDTIQFNPSANAWVDLAEFEGHLAAAERDGQQDLQATIRCLSAAAQLYRGRFMEGFFLKDCPEFEDWMLLRRENASLKFQKALRGLADAHVSVGAWEAALAALRQLLRDEPWDESAHRQVMSLLALHDQRSAAIAQYEHCRQVLMEELSVEPEEETTRLAERIRQGKFPGINGDAGDGKAARETPFGEKPLSSIRLAKEPRASFVGRQPELARLRRALTQALEGRGQAILITGEAGRGKTSLAWEFAYQAMAAHPELLAVAGGCNAVTGSEDPYLPFREIVQMLAVANETRPAHPFLPEHLRRLSEAFPDVIKSLLAAAPELIGPFIPVESLAGRVETFGPGEHPWQTGFKRIQERVAAGLPAAGSPVRQPIESITRLLFELSHHRPLILFLDDLQWADAGSLDLLRYLCNRLSGGRVLFLGAYRPQDVALGRQVPGLGWQPHPLEPVRLELQRQFGDMQVDLDRSAGLEMVNALVDLEPNLLGKPFRQALYRQTNGNPLFTLELLHSLQARRDLLQDPQGRWQEGTHFSWGSLPARVEAVVAGRLGRLLPGEQALLRAASVEGEAFSAEVAARVGGQDERQAIRWLGGSLSREQQIVYALDVTWIAPPAGGSPVRLSRYRFRHSLFQKYLYHQLDPVERSALHEAVGEALASLYGPAAGQISLTLAWHFEQAGRLARAAGYLLEAGKQSVNLSAPLQAQSLYDRCLGLIRQLPESPERARLESQCLLAAKNLPSELSKDLDEPAHPVRPGSL